MDEAGTADEASNAVIQRATAIRGTGSGLAMGVSDSQLKTWSNQGSTTTSATTYTSVQTALKRAENLEKYKYDVYLTGSYGNHTNIYGNSDVDVIAELTSAWYDDTTLLPPNQKEAYDRQWTASALTFNGFRDDVHQALLNYYGANLVTARNKCIAIRGDSGRQDADVVPCLEHRVYTQFSPLTLKHYDGIKFFNRKDNTPVVNFPQLHMQNGETKNKRVRFYKRTIRVLKNWRDKLVAEGSLAKDDAPSYFVECLCWNIPDDAFTKNTWTKTILACLQFLHGATFEPFWCQNGVIPLFGSAREQWSVATAKGFRNALIADWNK